MLRKERLQLLCPILGFFAIRCTGAHFAQPHKEVHHLCVQVLFLFGGPILGLLLEFLVSIRFAIKRLGLLTVFVNSLGVTS